MYVHTLQDDNPSSPNLCNSRGVEQNIVPAKAASTESVYNVIAIITTRMRHTTA